MALALEEAKAAAARDEVPIGAVLVHEGQIIAQAGNRTREMNDPSAHAEMLVIQEACKKARAQRIPDYDLFVTLEPCTMCAAAISFARIRRVIIGALDEKGGGIIHGAQFYEQTTCHHRPIVEHIGHEESSLILKEFFKSKRQY